MTKGAPLGAPQTVEKGVLTPWPPLRGGSARRRWGRELYGCPKYFGLWQGSLPPPLRSTAPPLAQAPPPPYRGSLSRRGRQGPWPPLRGGSRRSGWGREPCRHSKYFGPWQSSTPPPLRGTSPARGGKHVLKKILLSNYLLPKLTKKRYTKLYYFRSVHHGNHRKFQDSQI